MSLDVHNDGFDPFRFAIQNVDNPDVAIYLLNMCPLMINFVDQRGGHILHHACIYGHLNLLKYFFEISDLHLDFNVLDNSGIPPMVHAAQNGHLKVVKYLIENIGVNVDFNAVIDDDDNPFQYICCGENFEVVKYFFENHASSINFNIANTLRFSTTSFELQA